MNTTLKTTIQKVARKANHLYPHFERKFNLSDLLMSDGELIPDMITEPVYINHTYYYL